MAGSHLNLRTEQRQLSANSNLWTVSYLSFVLEIIFYRVNFDTDVQL